MKRLFCLCAATLLLGCTQGDTQARATVDRDTLTRRQKDSIIATMPLPGSKGVGNALKAADRIQERADRLDSLNASVRRH